VSSWPRSYCSKIYIYICNRCLTVTATFESSISACDEMYSIQLLCDKVCQWLAADRLFSPGTLVSSMNKCDLLDTTEILMKIVLNFHNWLCGYIQTHLPYDWAQGYPIMMWRRKKHTHSWWVVFIKRISDLANIFSVVPFWLKVIFALFVPLSLYSYIKPIILHNEPLIKYWTKN
jgi:hypothetical protein